MSEPSTSTSRPKIAPAIGVPKIVAKPAPMPQMTTLRRSRRLSRRSEERPEASEAPIWAAGPSLPTDPPTPIVTTVAASLIGATASAMRPARWCTASMTLSVPWPSASGARKRTRRCASTKPGGSQRSRQGARAPSAIARSRVRRKIVVPRPARTPTATARSVHLTRLATRVPCSANIRAQRCSCGVSLTPPVCRTAPISPSLAPGRAGRPDGRDGYRARRRSASSVSPGSGRVV